LESVESGIGQVRNYLLLEGAEKTVVRAPFLSKGHIGVDSGLTLYFARFVTSFFFTDSSCGTRCAACCSCAVCWCCCCHSPKVKFHALKDKDGTEEAMNRA
jgi:hypothetical protein